MGAFLTGVVGGEWLFFSVNVTVVFLFCVTVRVCVQRVCVCVSVCLMFAVCLDTFIGVHVRGHAHGVVVGPVLVCVRALS